MFAKTSNGRNWKSPHIHLPRRVVPGAMGSPYPFPAPTRERVVGRNRHAAFATVPSVRASHAERLQFSLDNTSIPGAPE